MNSRLLDVYTPIALDLSHGEGVYLIDKAGKRYLDTYAGIAVNALGHNHPVLIEALNKAAQRFFHVSNFFRTDSEERLAQRLCNHTDSEKVFFANSGSEVNEAALKLARKRGRTIHDNKTKILSVNQAFHGRTSGGMALSGMPDKRVMYAPTLPGIDHVNFNDVDDLTTKMDDNVCAIFLELIHGSSGIHVLSDAFLQTVQSLAKMHDVLIIIDEVQTGLLRTGSMFAYHDRPITPDIITTAKALGGGLPLGAMMVRNPYETVFTPGDHGTTFGGNPLACALGEALLDHIETKPFQETLHANMAYLEARLTTITNDFPELFTELRGTGYMWGLECPHYASTLQKKAQQEGLLLNVTGGSVIRLLPSLTFEREHIDQFETLLRKAIKRL